MTESPSLATATAAASVFVRDLLAGPERPALVLAAGPAATYLDVGGRVLAVVSAGGVRLPCAVMLAGDGRPPVAGSRLAVGGGAVHQDGRRLVTVRRWFDPRVRLAGVDQRAVARFAGLVRSRGRVDALLPVDEVERLADDLRRGDARGAVAVLIGRGTGLTPAGDDLLAGALAALRALGSPAAGDLGSAVQALEPGATTRLSAALLEAADVAGVVPEAADVLRALAGAGRLEGGGRLEGAAGRLVDLGHTSGWHLAAGLLVGVVHAGRRAARVPASGSGVPARVPASGSGVPARVPASGCDGCGRLGTPAGSPVQTPVGSPACGPVGAGRAT